MIRNKATNKNMQELKNKTMNKMQLQLGGHKQIKAEVKNVNTEDKEEN